MNTSPGCVALLLVSTLIASAAHGYDPGDVNGDGEVDAQDLSCAAVTIFDPDAGCAVATEAALEHVLTVSPAGGDFTSIQAALDSIPAPTSGRWLIRVGPGTYEERVTMRASVDIEGTGEGVTFITQNASPSPDTGTVVGADNAELRHVTVLNQGGVGSAIGLFCDGTSPSLAHVTVEAHQGHSTTAAIYCTNDGGPHTADVHAWASSPYGPTSGLYFEGAASPQDVDIRGLDADASYGTDAAGIRCVSGVLRLSGVEANGSYGTGGSYGLLAEDCTVSVIRSTLVGEGGSNRVGIQFADTDGSADERLDVANSEIIGPELTVSETGSAHAYIGGSLLMGATVSGDVQCAGVWDGDYLFYPSSCPAPPPK